MGTNMSMHAERRVDGHWHFLGEMKKSSLYEWDPEHERPFVPKPIYNTRNYSLFAILANVENGVLIEPYDYIALPRGLPDDLSPELKTYAEDPRNYDWTTITSWVTLKEVISFDWGKIRKQYAIVDERVAHLFHPERGFPLEWPHDLPVTYSPTKKEYANASWTETYADAVGWDVMELFNNLAQEYRVTEDVRFVMWFSY